MFAQYLYSYMDLKCVFWSYPDFMIKLYHEYLKYSKGVFWKILQIITTSTLILNPSQPELCKLFWICNFQIHVV